FQNHRIDLIVAVGPHPIQFLAERSKTFLPGVPVIICCSTREEAENPTLDSRFTGTWLVLEPSKTLDVAARLLPATTNVVLVGGTSPFDRANYQFIKNQLSSYESRFVFTYLTDLTMESVLEKVGKLPPDSIVLYVTFFRDSSGKTFVNATSALPAISAA